MERLILQLRKALVHYEECVDVCAAEHIMGEALGNLTRACNAVALECCNKIDEMLED